MNKIKKFFLLFLLFEMLFSYAPAFAQVTPAQTTAANAATYTGVSSQIEQYLCSPNTTTGNPLFQCINQLYKFAIVLASVFGVFFIVIAGYIYMSAEGNNESVDKAKSILTSTITSIVILLAGFVLLKALNPDLVTFNNIQPPSVNLTGTGSAPTGAVTTGTGSTASTPGTGGTATGSAPHGTAGSGACAPITNSSNPVSVSNLQNTCLAPNATLFSEISNEETGGGQSIPSQSDKCADGNPVSFGLFQINITQAGINVGGQSCASAFSKPYTGSDKSCVVVNQALYQQCVAAALDPNQNIQMACGLSNNGTNLTAWNGSCFAKWVPN